MIRKISNKNYNDLWIPFALIICSLIDLRTEVILLLDYFTWSALIFALSHHFLSVFILIVSPNLIRTYINSSRL